MIKNSIAFMRRIACLFQSSLHLPMIIANVKSNTGRFSMIFRIVIIDLILLIVPVLGVVDVLGGSGADNGAR